LAISNGFIHFNELLRLYYSFDIHFFTVGGGVILQRQRNFMGSCGRKVMRLCGATDEP